MKLSIFAVRDGERVFWPLGFLLVVFAASLAGTLGFLLFRLVLPTPVFPALLFAATMPPGMVVGRQCHHVESPRWINYTNCKRQVPHNMVFTLGIFGTPWIFGNGPWPWYNSRSSYIARFVQGGVVKTFR